MKFKMRDPVVTVHWSYFYPHPRMHHGTVVGLDGRRWTRNPDPDRFDHTEEPWVGVEVRRGYTVDVPERYVFGSGSDAKEYIVAEARRRLGELESVAAHPRGKGILLWQQGGLDEYGVLVIWTYYHGQPVLHCGQPPVADSSGGVVDINPDRYAQIPVDASVRVELSPGCTTVFPQRFTFQTELEALEFIREEAHRRIAKIEEVLADPLAVR